nr:unnamed protein product [Callosobruchus analis]
MNIKAKGHFLNFGEKVGGQWQKIDNNSCDNKAIEIIEPGCETVTENADHSPLCNTARSIKNN